MRRFAATLLFIVSLSFSACSQPAKKRKDKTKTENSMDTLKLTNETVKKAFNAWQNGDSKLFLSFFTADAKLYDDGNPRNFSSFVKDACGHEKFVSITKVENNGLDIYGRFHTESWGDFNTYFKFHINDEGKINQLDIGQAK